MKCFSQHQTFTGKSTYEEFVRHVDNSKQLRAMRSVSDDEEERLAISRFDARQRKPNEEWGDLTNALTGLAKKAYPRKSDMEIKSQVKSRVLSQVQNHPMFSNDISLHDLVITLMAEDVIPVPYSGEGGEAAWENWITKLSRKLHEEIWMRMTGLNGSKPGLMIMHLTF
eukprot:Em0006g682a